MEPRGFRNSHVTSMSTMPSDNNQLRALLPASKLMSATSFIRLCNFCDIPDGLRKWEALNSDGLASANGLSLAQFIAFAEGGINEQSLQVSYSRQCHLTSYNISRSSRVNEMLFYRYETDILL